MESIIISNYFYRIHNRFFFILGISIAAGYFGLLIVFPPFLCNKKSWLNFSFLSQHKKTSSQIYWEDELSRVTTSIHSRLTVQMEKPSSGISPGTFIPLRYNRRSCRSLNYFNCAPPKPSSICSIHTPSQPGKATLNCSSPGGFSVMRYANVLSFSMGLAYKFI